MEDVVHSFVCELESWRLLIANANQKVTFRFAFENETRQLSQHRNVRLLFTIKLSKIRKEQFMLNISIVQIIVILAIVVASIVLGRWLGRKTEFRGKGRQPTGSLPYPESNPKLKESVNVSPRKVKFFTSAKDRDTTIFMLLCFATVWLLAWWFAEHIDVATVSLVLGSLITVIITMGTALYPEGNSDTHNGDSNGNRETPPSTDR